MEGKHYDVGLMFAVLESNGSCLLTLTMQHYMAESHEYLDEDVFDCDRQGLPSFKSTHVAKLA